MSVQNRRWTPSESCLLIQRLIQRQLKSIWPDPSNTFHVRHCEGPVTTFQALWTGADFQTKALHVPTNQLNNRTVTLPLPTTSTNQTTPCLNRPLRVRGSSSPSPSPLSIRVICSFVSDLHLQGLKTAVPPWALHTVNESGLTWWALAPSPASPTPHLLTTGMPPRIPLGDDAQWTVSSFWTEVSVTASWGQKPEEAVRWALLPALLLPSPRSPWRSSGWESKNQNPKNREN